MCIHVQSITYMHPDKDVLFSNVSFTISKGKKVALIGNNGSGKSTLMRLITKELLPSEGQIICPDIPYSIPQHFGQFNHLTVAGALGIERKLYALHAILQGDASIEHFTALADDWKIEEKAVAALNEWGLVGVPLSYPMHLLSGGEKTKVFLAGITIYSPAFILMDEPTNHLDDESRIRLYRFITTAAAGILVVSHDRTLLNLLFSTYELTAKGVTYYAGNYDFYKEQKKLAVEALQTRLKENEKQLQKARKQAREVMERQQKHDVRGKKQNVKKGVGKMAMHTFRDQAEKSTVRLGDVHVDKIRFLAGETVELHKALPDMKTMKVNFNSSSLHIGKILIVASSVNYSYGENPLWSSPLEFTIKSGDRIHLKGSNGSGKTTLLRLITGSLAPTQGSLIQAEGLTYVYLDQEYSIIRNDLSVLEQFALFNSELYDNELRTILNRFLFPVSIYTKFWTVSIRSYYCSVSVFTCNSASLELPPTIISKFPAMVRMVFVCASHHSNCLGVNSNSTLTVFPAGICTRLKARSVLTGPSASSCFFRYTCTTSSPSRLPVLVTGTIILAVSPTLIVCSSLMLP